MLLSPDGARSSRRRGRSRGMSAGHRVRVSRTACARAVSAGGRSFGLSMLGGLALEGLVHGVAVLAVLAVLAGLVACGEDEVGFVVLEHLQSVSRRFRVLRARKGFDTFCGHFV